MRLNLSKLPEAEFRRQQEIKRLYDLALAEPDIREAAALKRKAFALLEEGMKQHKHELVEAHLKDVNGKLVVKAA